MKALIVEDELLARAGLRSLIEWEKMGITLLEDAKDGREALRCIEQEQPDVLLLDLNIPEISGLELLEIIRDRGLPVKTIVISCYDDFSTVKKAMKLGAMDYIRKFGLSREELTAALSGLVRLSPGPKPAVSKSAAQTRDEIRRKLEHIPEEYRSGCCLAFYTRCRYSGELTDLKIVETIVEQYYQKLGKEFLSMFYEGKQLMLLKEEAGEEEVRQLLRQITPFVSGECYAGLTGCQIAGQEPRFLIRVANTLETFAFYDPQMKLYRFERPLESQKQYPFDAEACIKELEAGIARMSEQELLAVLERVFDEIDRHRYISVSLVKRLMIEILSCFSHKAEKLGGTIEEIEAAGSYKHYQKVVGLNSLQDCRLWWAEFVRCFTAQFFIRQKSSESDIMERTLQYIEANLGQSIQLSDAARYIGVSEPYLSSFFKKSMNENFIPYVNRCKVERAKRLLEEGMMVYQVADLLGYENSTYFSKVFKRVEGVAPEVYRREHGV